MPSPSPAQPPAPPPDARRGAILVTGATGTVGAEVVRLLTAGGSAVRAASRAARRAAASGDAPGDVPGAATPVVLDFHDPATFRDALDGVDRVFLVRPPALADVRRWMVPFLAAARAAGVSHVVFLSLLGAERNPVVPHRRLERELEARGPAYTFLRASFFMQNLLTTHLDDVRRGELVVPAGRGRTSFVDARDVAAAAVQALTTPGHDRRAYALTGGEALTYDEVAATLSAELRRPVAYRRPSLARFVRHMRGAGHPADFVLVTAAIYTAARLGLAARVTDDLPRLLGRAPIALREFVRDHRAAFDAASGAPAGPA